MEGMALFDIGRRETTKHQTQAMSSSLPSSPDSRPPRQSGAAQSTHLECQDMPCLLDG